MKPKATFAVTLLKTPTENLQSELEREVHIYKPTDILKKFHKMFCMEESTKISLQVSAKQKPFK